MRTLAFVLIASPAVAGDCVPFFQGRTVVRQYVPAVVTDIQPVTTTDYAVTQPLFQVGYGLQNAAELERVRREAVNLYKEGLADGLKIYGGQNGTSIAKPFVDTQPTITAKCAKCHDSESPAGDIILGGDSTYTAEQITKALRILSGDDIPEAMAEIVSSLKAEDMAALMSEFLSNEVNK